MILYFVFGQGAHLNVSLSILQLFTAEHAEIAEDKKYKAFVVSGDLSGRGSKSEARYQPIFCFSPRPQRSLRGIYVFYPPFMRQFSCSGIILDNSRCFNYLSLMLNQ
jgi:hypothetical protein